MLFSYDCSLEVLLPFVRILLLSSTTSLQSLGRLYEPPGISPGRVETSIRRGGQLRCGCFANLLQYLRATNYQNIMRFDKVIAAIIKGCIFFASQCSFMSIKNLRKIQTGSSLAGR